MRYNHLEYLVKWKGYDESHNQWEVHTQVHAKSKIAQFHCKYPSAVCHINAVIIQTPHKPCIGRRVKWRRCERFKGIKTIKRQSDDF
jgi:hypothetical protein